jgi:hypothetical protein
MSFLYNGEERYCPVFVPGREQLPCRRQMCLAFEIKFEYHEPEGVLEKYIVSYCHALKKDLDVEKIEESKEEGSEPHERKE